jgi:glutamate-ammonia-ligase adenylyltransferase
VQLTHRAGFTPHLGTAIAELEALGLAPPGLSATYDFLTRLLVTLRLVAPDAQPPAAATRALIARALGVDDWDAVVASFAATRQEVSDYWAMVAEGRGDR